MTGGDDGTQPSGRAAGRDGAADRPAVGPAPVTRPAADRPAPGRAAVDRPGSADSPGAAGGAGSADDPTGVADRRPISIAAVVDVVGALASGGLHDNLYLYDTARAAGSTGQGTPVLRTAVRAGDRLIWTAIPLECEAYLAIDAIEIDPEVCVPVRRLYPGTDIAYWTGIVRTGIAAVESTPYRMAFRLGGRAEPMAVGPQRPSLAGER